MSQQWTRKDLVSLDALSPQEIALLLDTAKAFKGVGERTLKKVPALRGRRVSMIPQDPKFSLNPVKRIGAQIEETLVLHGRLSRRERQEHALSVLEAVGIDDPHRVYAAYPHELSGGMGQRAMIAVMLVSGPDLLIADEPTSALDVIVREQVLALLDRLVSELYQTPADIVAELRAIISEGAR